MGFNDDGDACGICAKELLKLCAMMSKEENCLPLSLLAHERLVGLNPTQPIMGVSWHDDRIFQRKDAQKR